jgi:hypothetical protein
MRLTIEAAAYRTIEGHPQMGLTLALLGPGGSDRVAWLDWEEKPSIAVAGIHFLGAEFEDIVPPIAFTPEDGAPLLLRGFTDDPVADALYRRFKAAVAAGSFAPGPMT